MFCYCVIKFQYIYITCAVVMIRVVNGDKSGIIFNISL